MSDSSPGDLMSQSGSGVTKTDSLRSTELGNSSDLLSSSQDAGMPMSVRPRSSSLVMSGSGPYRMPLSTRHGVATPVLIGYEPRPNRSPMDGAKLTEKFDG